MKHESRFQLLFLLLLASPVYAQDFPEPETIDATPMNEVNVKSQKTKKKKVVVDSILNFESDMIEGEKRRPDLFMQTNVEDLNLDSILYLRKDFNDFHAVDHKRRPRHFRFKVKK